MTATAITDPAATVTADPAKDNKVEAALAQLTAANAQLAQKLEDWQKAATKPAPEPKKSWKDRFYDDDVDGAVADIKKEAKAEALEAMTAIQRQDNERTMALSQLANEYPELANNDDPLMKRARELHNGLSDNMKNTALGYRVAVREAAAELGVLPKAKRKTDMEDDDAFAMSGGGKGKPGSGAPRKRKEGELSEETLLFAELLGRPVDDAKYVERLKKANERKTWGKYRKVS